MYSIEQLVRAYKSMDIENLDPKEKKEKSNSFLSKPTKPTSFDISQPQVRVGKQMQIIRKYRDEIKNGNV